MYFENIWKLNIFYWKFEGYFYSQHTVIWNPKKKKSYFNMSFLTIARGIIYLFNMYVGTYEFQMR